MFIRNAEDVIYIKELINKLLLGEVDTVRIDYNIANYIGAYPDLFPMTNFYGSINRATKINLENQTELSVRWLINHETKRRYEGIFNVIHWYLAIVFFNNNAISVLRSPDVRDDGYAKMFILDKDNHQRATGFIFNHMESDPGPELEMWGLDAPSGSFGGDIQPHVRSMHYDPALCLEYKVPSKEKELNYLLNYTIDPHFNWEEVEGYNPL